MIFIGVTVGGLIGGWIGSWIDHGNMMGGWGIILGAIGSLAGIWVAVKVVNYYT